MNCRPTYICDGQAKRCARADDRRVRCPVRESADYKRPSARGPLVSAPMTSAYLCGGRRSRPGVLVEMTGVGGLREEGLGAGRS